MTAQNLEQVTKGEIIAFIAEMRTSKLEPKKSSEILEAINNLADAINKVYTQEDWSTLQTHSPIDSQVTSAYHSAKKCFEKPAPRISGGFVDVYARR